MESLKTIHTLPPNPVYRDYRESERPEFMLLLNGDLELRSQRRDRGLLDILKKIPFIITHAGADFLFNRFRFPGSRKIARFLVRQILPVPKGRVQCPTLYGFDIVITMGIGSEKQDIFYHGFYEPGTLHVMKNVLSPGDVFVDVGASVGLMSLYASGLVGDTGKVLAFEPVSESNRDLCMSRDLNRKNNIQVFELGLGDAKAEIPIYFDRVCPSMVKPLRTKGLDHRIVKTDRLDEVLKDCGISSVKMIKIDVEGYEYPVLRGSEKLLSSPQAPLICMEYIERFHKGKPDPMVFLKNINQFSFYQLEKGSDTIGKLVEVQPGNVLHKEDNVFCLLPHHREKVFSRLIKSKSSTIIQRKRHSTKSNSSGN